MAKQFCTHPNLRALASRQCHPSRRSRAGFTLVELLTVIVIIGILVGLVSGAVIRARNSAKRAVISNEINGLDAAFKSYMEKYGEYPPDFTDQKAVIRHLNRIFPRYAINDWSQLSNAVRQYGVNLDSLSSSQGGPAAAVVFWLGGPPKLNPSGGTNKQSTEPGGFSADPSNPFSKGGARLPILFDFDPTRLVRDTGHQGATEWIFYYPQTGAAPGPQSAPYVYFKSRSYGCVDPTGEGGSQTGQGYDPQGKSKGSGKQVARVWAAGRQETVYPYYYYKAPRSSIPPRSWYQAQTFQIVSAGLDNHFGSESSSSLGSYCLPLGSFGKVSEQGYEFDNITNFSKGGTIEDLK